MNNEFLTKVFKWLGLGLLVTFLTAYAISINETMLSFILNKNTMIILALLEIICAIWLAARIHHMSTTTATTLYLGYSALTGLTLSTIFLTYQIDSIIWIFLSSSIVFIIFALLGKNIKVNLSNIGIFLFIGLLSLLILELINLFIMSNTLDITLCILSLIIFIGYIAYDIHKISNISTDNDNYAIIGAFNLYLDFINIFISLLKLFGKSKN